jgi:ATP-dependent DNA helicase RecQ
LEHAGVLHVQPRDGVLRLRILATPERLTSEGSTLTPNAKRVISRIMAAKGADRIEVASKELGLRPFELDAVTTELEARQLVYIPRQIATASLDIGPSAQRTVERHLRHLARLRSSGEAKLDAMVGYATTRRCRRAHILRYFGDQSLRDRCGHCDNCDTRVAGRDGS